MKFQGPAIIAALFAVGWLLWFYRHTAAGRIVYLWLGPRPNVGELWSSYQLRWAFYSLNWLAQIVVVFVVLNVVLVALPKIQEHHLPWAFQFGLVLGATMAVLSFVAFGLRAANRGFLARIPRLRLRR